MHTKITNINCLWLINETEANHSIKNKVGCERCLWGGGGSSREGVNCYNPASHKPNHIVVHSCIHAMKDWVYGKRLGGGGGC